MVYCEKHLKIRQLADFDKWLVEYMEATDQGDDFIFAIVQKDGRYVEPEVQLLWERWSAGEAPVPDGRRLVS